MILKLTSGGRGRGYSPARGVYEALQRFLYAFGWPAKLLALAPGVWKVRVIEHRLPLLPLGRTRRPLRIAFASDLHIGPLTPAPLLDAAFETLAGLAPDVLALGGDYVSYEATSDTADRLEALVRKVPAATKLAVFGNHDLWTRHEHLERALIGAGVTLLSNRAATLPPPYDDVAIVGLDDPWAGVPDAQRAFAETEAPVRIVLCHAPECLPHVQGRGARLALCGHTHGGQVALPGGPLLVPGKWGRRYPAGLHDLGGLKLFVSRGVGFSDLPLRTFAPADVALLVLE